MRKLQMRQVLEGREVRFTNFVDEESLAFENAAVEIQTTAAMEQTLAYAKLCGREFYLMQTRAADGTPAMQAIIYLGRPKVLSSFAMASVPNLHRAKNILEEEFGLKMLRELGSEIPNAMTLRLQPQRFDAQELTGFEMRASTCGFNLAPPLGIVRTMLLDLDSTPEALAAKMGQKTRSKIRHASRAKMELRVLTEESYAAACRNATNESRRRSGSDDTPYDFESAFRVAKAHPDRAQIIGLFLKDKPGQLMAYVIGYKNGARAEYASAGSFSDPELRSMPFNYFLFWQLANWARNQGATQIDMGGITDGGENDPLQGVSRFKRSIASLEVETGREMVIVLRPLRLHLYQGLKEFKSWLKAEAGQTGLLPAYD
ncbi:MAG: GNAT family N-acetyltransferase [Bdellovibrionales bacterium]|nr:GNAT family N-acetyltransferase [Oligoflexia bacterium]